MYRLMISLLLLLFYFPNYVNPCLATGYMGPISMGDSRCPKIHYTDKDEIRYAKYGSYLISRKMYYPKSVSVLSGTVIDVEVPDKSVLDNFYFMIFRTNGPPIYSIRRIPDEYTSIINPIGLECKLPTGGGSPEWHYFGGVVQNMSFVIMSDECSCMPFPMSDTVKGQCDIVSKTCPNANNSLVLYAMDVLYNMVLPRLGSITIYDATCVNKYWYYNGIKMYFDPDPSDHLTCYDQLVSVIDLQPSDQDTTTCNCFAILTITTENRYMMLYDWQDNFVNYTLDPVQITYNNKPTCQGTTISCPNSEMVVIFSRNYEPMKYSPDKLPYITCRPTVLGFDEPDAPNYWYVDGIMLSEAAVGCFSSKPPTIEMNGCQCPQIEYINQAGIQNNPLSAYLAHRPTFYANTVNVTKDCAVTVDAQANSQYDNYYFMIFRENGQPIFNKRFVPEFNKDPFNPTGLSCVKVGDEYEWQFYGGKLEGMTFAMQSDEEMCGCALWNREASDPVDSLQNLYGTCDIFKATCPQQENIPAIVALPFFDFYLNGVIDDTTCVDKQWYFNGMKLENPLIACGPKNYHPIDSMSMPLEWPCGCLDFLNVQIFTTDPNAIEVFDPALQFSNRTAKAINATYSAEANYCRPNFQCGASETLVIYSLSHDPFVYENGEVPSLECHQTPLASSSESPSYWFLAGNMLITPAFGCYLPKACGCSFKYMDESNIKELVGTHPFYQNISSLTISAPNDNCVPDDVCPDKISCPAGLTLVIFDTETATTYPNGSLSSTCFASSKKWTVDGALFDRLYATCVDYGCICPFKIMDESNIQQLVGTHEFYQNVSVHPISAPLDNCVPDEVCPTQISCAAGLTVVVFDIVGAQLYPKGSLISFCDTSKKWWYIQDSFFDRVYATCVDYGCSCSFKYMDESDVEELVGTHPFYKNISSLTISAPNDNCVPDNVCPDKISCPAGFTLVVFDTETATTYPNGSLSSSCSVSKWTVDGAQFDRLFATCVQYECPCAFKYLDESNIQELVGSHPFYKNISSLTISAPADSCVPDEVCPDKVSCPAGLTLVIFDTESAVTYPNGSLSSTCFASSKMWSVDGSQFDRLYATCVQYECPCAFKYMDESNVQELVGTHPFYQNISSLTISAPADSCVPDEVCPYKVSCPVGLTLVIFDTESAVTYPNGSLSSSCSASSKKWSVDGSQFDRLYATCVQFACPCPFKYMDESNIQELVGSHPFYHNISSLTISAPNDNCVPDDVCPDKISCPAGLTLVIFDTDTAATYPNGSLSSSCSASKWSVEGSQFDRLYATCVQYDCPCSLNYMDNNTFLEIFGRTITYGDYSSLQMLPVLDSCIGDDACPTRVTCPAHFTVVVFGTKKAKTFFSSESESTTCDPVTKNWTIGEEAVQFDRLYVICMSMLMQSCPCPPIANITSSMIASEPSWSSLKNEQTWPPKMAYGNFYNQCGASFDCGTDVDSYHTVLAYPGEAPVVIYRVVNSGSISPSDLSFLSCSSNQWNLYGYSVPGLSIACVSDMETCSCPTLAGSAKLGEAAIVTDRSTPPGKYCGLIQASCPSGGAPKLVGDNINPITPQGKSVFDELICVKQDDGSRQWNYGSIPLVNPSISCLVVKECSCGELLSINGKTDLSIYDSKGDFADYQVAKGLWSYDDCRDSVGIQCPAGYAPVVFGNGINWFKMNTSLSIECITNPINNDLKMWFVEGRKVVDPAIACIEDRNYDPTHGCPCTGLYTFTETPGLRWSPLTAYKQNCKWEYSCGGTGVQSYSTIFGNEFFTRMTYINRVVDGVAMPQSEPRPIDILECSTDTFGNHTWTFGGYPVEEGRGVTCRADLDSCKCPAITANDRLGEMPTLATVSNASYCSFYKAYCPDDYVPKIVSDNWQPLSVPYEDATAELACLADQNGVFKWHVDNYALNNPSISCAPRPTCACGDIKVIRTREELDVYDVYKWYGTSEILEPVWNYTDCPTEVNFECPSGYNSKAVFMNGFGFVAVIDSIKCVRDPINPGNSFMWWNNLGFRVRDPAIACLNRPPPS